ncbi:MAG: Nramp family divalent metal transporter [Aureliella sp.]
MVKAVTCVSFEESLRFIRGEFVSKFSKILSTIGPGILVAATGVGAGDLATATLTGANVGTAILWAVVIGAGLKFVLNEGLTRWQLVTGKTLIEGVVDQLPRWALWGFLAYLIGWSFLVAMALMSACGVCAHALVPIFDDASRAKVVFGITHSLLALGLVFAGGYRLFERVMSVCIGVMFVVCCATAIMMAPDASEIAKGLLLPTIPKLTAGGLTWTIALLGGVGGTVTVLCYGYWIREEGRESAKDLPACKLDLGVGYAMTAVFGIAMVIIGNQLGNVDGKGASMIVNIGKMLASEHGSIGMFMRWAFLIGAWGAVFSSLLGVWQSVPYLFTDFTRRFFRFTDQNTKIDTTNALYRRCLVAIAILPTIGLISASFSSVMMFNGLMGAVFIPMLAGTLLFLNGKRDLLREHTNNLVTKSLLVLTLCISGVAMAFQVANLLGIFKK